MGKARELAEKAIRIAADIRSDDIEAFEWQPSFDPDIWKVSLHLTNGMVLRYLILEQKERNTPSGEFHLW